MLPDLDDAATSGYKHATGGKMGFKEASDQAKRDEITIHKRGGASFLRVADLEQWIAGQPA